MSNWYVDPLAAGNAAGTSWANAWTHIGGINYSGVTAGDTIYFSGGTTTQDYTIDAAAQYPGQWLGIKSGVTYKIGQEAGHNGIAIFDNVAAAKCIVLSQTASRNGVVFSGDAGDGVCHFRFNLSTAGASKGIDADAAYNWRVTYCEFLGGKQGMGGYLTQGTFEIDHCHFKQDHVGTSTCISFNSRVANGYDQILIHDNLLEVPRHSWSDGLGADAINASGYIVQNVNQGGDPTSGGISVYNNTMIGYLMPTFTGGQHQDGWQCEGGSYLKYYNNVAIDIANYFWFPEGNTSLAVGGYGFSHVRVYNNITVLSQTVRGSQQAFAISGSSTVGQDGWAKVITDEVVANNLVVNYPTAFYFDYFDHKTDAPAGSYIDCFEYNNIAVNCGGFGRADVQVTAATNANLTTAQAVADFVNYVAGADDNDYHLKVGATALIDQGTDATSLGVTLDYDGIARGVPPDIGPYQYTGVDTTPPVIVLAEILAGGNVLRLHINENCTIGAGGSGGVTLSFTGGAVTPTYGSGAGSTALDFPLSRIIPASAGNGTGGYTQPGAGFQDTAGNDLATIASFVVVNNSTQTDPVPAPTGLGATDFGCRKIALAWTDNSAGLCTHSVERSLTTGSGFTEIVEVLPGVVAFDDVTVADSTQYFYRVRAHSLFVGYSTYCTEANATTTAPAIAPRTYAPVGVGAGIGL
jgi:hypothetical protein